ncbi:D-alanyl-D-alanine carboxypeptidase [Streptomyces sp. G45]|uniref:D-alanyl-D-alanine carboxypeptidase n=1 Tax=Streptomyces sp. G45 TaxID=3406627 RepID=UPI003C1F060E
MESAGDAESAEFVKPGKGAGASKPAESAGDRETAKAADSAQDARDAKSEESAASAKRAASAKPSKPEASAEPEESAKPEASAQSADAAGDPSPAGESAASSGSPEDAPAAKGSERADEPADTARPAPRPRGAKPSWAVDDEAPEKSPAAADDDVPTGGGGAESAVDMATAVFEAARGEARDEPDAPTSDKATAVFGTVRRDADAPKDDKDDKPADPRVDRATAVFRTTGPKAADKPAVDQATAVFKAVRPDDEAKPDADAKRGKNDRNDRNDENDKADEGDPKSPAGPAAGDRPVDQATAVFKAPRPAPVDQPTTMLKLGGDREGDGDRAKDAKDAKDAKSESDAERTSKFVALKPLDEPRVKPKTDPKSDPKAGPKAAPGADPKAAPQQAKPGAKPSPAQAPAPDAVPERTTQQPLPPKPPLDLLAELTNTPPPPETPTRTLVRRIKIWTPLVALLAIVFAVAQMVRPLPEPKLTLTAEDTFSFGGGKPSIPWPEDGQAAMDVDGIGTFGTSGNQKPVPIASIAKVMTTYLILRDHPIKKGTDGKTLTVDAEAQRHYEKGKPENESVVKVTKGQKISQYEALQAVMLPSANNVARMLARWDSGGDEKKFVAKMNETAKELGMKNTHYTDPSGLDKTTVSTAEDLVKLGRVAMENPTFKEIARQPKYEDLNGDEQKNYFGLVPTVAIGIKTGTTTAAGGNILFAAEKRTGGKTQVIIGAALAQFGKPGVANIDQVTKVVRDLISAGQDALTAKTVVRKGTVVGHVDDGLGGKTPVVTTKDVRAVGWSGLTAKLELGDGGRKVPHTAKAGERVGVLSVGDGTNRAIKVPVAVQKDLAEPGFGAKLTRVG